MATENKAVITLFGATGDLAKRKLYTALFKLYQKGYLQDHFALLGTSRHPYTDEEFQQVVRDSIKDVEETRKGEAAVNFKIIMRVNIILMYSSKGDYIHSFFFRKYQQLIND